MSIILQHCCPACGTSLAIAYSRRQFSCQKRKCVYGPANAPSSAIQLSGEIDTLGNRTDNGPMSSDEINRRIEFIIEQQAKFSTDIEQLKEVQAQQAENLTALAETVTAMQIEMREGFNNFIVANEVTRKLAEDVARLTINNSQRITAIEEKAS